jgi:hypothetical protein
MPVLAVVALALAVVIVAAAMGAVARGRRTSELAPPAIEPPRGPVDAERAAPEPATNAAAAQPEPPTEPPQAVEPAPAESRRSIIPPAVVESLASEPEPASEPVLVDEPEAVTTPPPAPEPASTPVVAVVVAAAPPPAPEPATPVVAVVVTAAPPPAPEPATPVVAVVVAADRASIEAEDPERKKARKLARLFASEIKLYNEKLVAEGRVAGDLYARLKDSIDQSLVAFERRIPEAVRAEFDYMHDELVRQLAEGDARKLGPQYRRSPRGS